MDLNLTEKWHVGIGDCDKTTSIKGKYWKVNSKAKKENAMYL